MVKETKKKTSERFSTDRDKVESKDVGDRWR